VAEHREEHVAGTGDVFGIARDRLGESLVDAFVEAGDFIPVVVEWEVVARTMIPPAETMSKAALRNHAAEILLAIAADMETAQSAEEQDAKSKGLAPLKAVNTTATAHGALRQLVGFDLDELTQSHGVILPDGH
jgi:hypothetical protein